jgi:hypothetical protein
VSGENGAGAEQEPAAQEVVRVQKKQLSRRDPAQLARAAAESAYWTHIKTPAQAVVVMAAGEELGLTPLASFQGITIIEGKIGYTGNLVATLVKQHPAYDYRVKEKTIERCEIEFGPAPAPGRDESGAWLPWPDAYGTSEFTIEDAERAELVKAKSNWAKWPRAMCFNRALTEGIRAYIPDVTAGTPAYTDDEIREVIQVEAEVEPEPVAAEADGLPAERVAHLLRGIEIVGPALGGVTVMDGLNLLLGSLGFDAFDPTIEYAPQLEKLTEEQADALDTELQKLVDQAEPVAADGEDAEEVDGTVVEEVANDA